MRKPRFFVSSELRPVRGPRASIALRFTTAPHHSHSTAVSHRGGNFSQFNASPATKLAGARVFATQQVCRSVGSVMCLSQGHDEVR